jgi:hypothetical protein
MGSHANLDKKAWKDHTPGNIRSVSVAEECEINGLDTLKGEIKPNTRYTNIPTILPLCINDEVVKDWWVAYLVCGCYEPRLICGSYYGLIEFEQAKVPAKGGVVWMTSVSVTDIPCCWKIVNFTGFDVPGVNTDFELASNYFPNVPPGCVMTPKCAKPDAELGKRVDLDITTYWKGCDDDYQKFRLILAQYKMCFQDPLLPMEKLNFIASIMQ